MADESWIGRRIRARVFGRSGERHSIAHIPLPTSFLANTEWQSVFVIELTPPFDDTVGLTKPGTKDAE